MLLKPGGRRLHSNNHWEIYLEEESKGRIPLSLSGSGLKTIILVLVHIHLLPVILNKSIQDFIFAFEELENNLHPSLQRRLLDYLRDVSKKNNCIFFLSTHSNVAIDQFSRDADAQIIHVTHDGETASARTVQTYIDNRGILDDLDVRASDLLQANGIIWVEGPSDRIYLNRWIELWSDGQLREGTHYQCVFYGGRLLSHLTAAEPSDAESAISMLSVNRNSIVLIDSDKRAATSRINETKQRIVSEINKQNGLAWVTKGREIENYLPIDVLTALLEVELPSKPDPYEDLFAFMDKHKNSAGTYYRGQKPLLAEKACQFMTKENLGSTLDLTKQMDLLCNKIREWNKLN